MNLVDTSIVIAAVTLESMTERAQSWLEDTPDLFTARWTLVEGMSALSAKVRRGDIRLAQRRAAAVALRALLDQHIAMTDSTSHQLTMAAAWCEQVELKLRGPDALHLAMAADRKMVLWTLDSTMAKAGQALGLDARLLS